MNTVKGTIIQFVVLGLVGIGIGVAANTVRAKNKIDWRRDYSETGSGLIEEIMKGKRDLAAAQTSVVSEQEEDIGGDLDTSDDAGFQVIGFDGVVEVFEDPMTTEGVNVIVDARPTDVFEEGHIPGAIQADHWKLVDDIDTLLDYAEGAEKIVVYCNGGDCKDSKLLCADLLEFEIPYGSIYLYPGGFEEWKLKGMPIATGWGEEE